MAVGKIEHVGIMVGNLETSIEFYKNVVGLEHLYTLGHQNGVIRLGFLAFPGLPDTQIELIEGSTSKVAPAGLVHHLAFTVDNIDEEYLRIRTLGIDGIDERISTLPNGSQYFFFKGPDGEALEFFKPFQEGSR